MSVTVLILAKFARNKPATLLKYELLSDVLHTLNLDNKKPFFARGSYLVTAAVYIRQVCKWLIKSFFLSRTTTKKINMLTMCNAKTEYKKIVMHEKRNYFFCVSLKWKLIYFLTSDYILLICDNKDTLSWHNILNDVQNKNLVLHEK